MYVNKKHYILLVLAFITFVVVTVGYSFLRNKIYSQMVNTADVLKHVNDMEQQKKREQDVSSAYSKLTEDQKLVKGYVISKERVVGFIEAVEKIGTDTSTDIIINSIETQAIVKTKNVQDNFSYYSTRIEIGGTWANVMRALTMVENMPYSITINKLSVYEDTPAENFQQVGTSTKALPKVTKKWKATLDIKILALE